MRGGWLRTWGGIYVLLASLLPGAALAQSAPHAHGLHLVVSLQERTLWLRQDSAVLLTAPVGVGKGTVLRHGSRTWDFVTPVGQRGVKAKAENPVWVPPDWHYIEIARKHGLRLVPLPARGGVPLADGARVVVRGQRVGRLWKDGRFEEVPPGEEIIFGDTLFVPPFGTANRRIPGELGRYKLDLGDGYLIHGTRDGDSIGRAASHGCIRVGDEALAFLYKHVPVGTPVFID